MPRLKNDLQHQALPSPPLLFLYLTPCATIISNEFFIVLHLPFVLEQAVEISARMCCWVSKQPQLRRRGATLCEFIRDIFEAIPCPIKLFFVAQDAFWRGIIAFHDASSFGSEHLMSAKLRTCKVDYTRKKSIENFRRVNASSQKYRIMSWRHCFLMWPAFFFERKYHGIHVESTMRLCSRR